MPTMPRLSRKSTDMQHVLDSFYSFNHLSVLGYGEGPAATGPATGCKRVFSNRQVDKQPSSSNPLRVILRALPVHTQQQQHSPHKQHATPMSPPSTTPLLKSNSNQ